jgi:hypothetical protein
MPPRGVHRRRPAGHRGSSCDGAVTPGRTRQPRPPPPRRMKRRGVGDGPKRLPLPSRSSPTTSSGRAVRHPRPRKERRAASVKVASAVSTDPRGTIQRAPVLHGDGGAMRRAHRPRTPSSGGGPWEHRFRSITAAGASLLPPGARRSWDRPALCRRSHAPGSSAHRRHVADDPRPIRPASTSFVIAA